MSYSGMVIPAPAFGQTSAHAQSKAYSRLIPRQSAARTSGLMRANHPRSVGATHISTHPAAANSSTLARHTLPCKLPGSPA